MERYRFAVVQANVLVYFSAQNSATRAVANNFGLLASNNSQIVREISALVHALRPTFVVRFRSYS